MFEDLADEIDSESPSSIAWPLTRLTRSLGRFVMNAVLLREHLHWTDQSPSWRGPEPPRSLRQHARVVAEVRSCAPRLLVRRRLGPVGSTAA
jgi:hypothetical protein